MCVSGQVYFWGQKNKLIRRTEKKKFCKKNCSFTLSFQQRALSGIYTTDGFIILLSIFPTKGLLFNDFESALAKFAYNLESDWLAV